jgi:hypothetical protein
MPCSPSCPPSAGPSAKGGRPRKRGRLLRKPQQIARDARTPWQSTEATLYGKKTTVRFKTLCAQWYRATGTRLLRLVIVATDSGTIPYRVFFSFDSTLEVRAILEKYAGRWGIEVAQTQTIKSWCASRWSGVFSSSFVVRDAAA